MTTNRFWERVEPWPFGAACPAGRITAAIGRTLERTGGSGYTVRLRGRPAAGRARKWTATAAGRPALRGSYRIDAGEPARITVHAPRDPDITYRGPRRVHAIDGPGPRFTEETACA